MKRWFLVLLVCVALMAQANAQNTVASIRQEYQGVQQNIRLMMQEDGLPPEYYHLHVVQNLPGTGLHDENIHMFYGELPSEEEGDPYPPHFLHFVTAKYNFAVREYYEEFLYDDKGQVKFIYIREPNIDVPNFQEFRLWYDGPRLLQFMVKATDDPDVFNTEVIPASAFKQVYLGKTIPTEYDDVCKGYLGRSKQYLEMFKGIDDNTHL